MSDDDPKCSICGKVIKTTVDDYEEHLKDEIPNPDFKPVYTGRASGQLISTYPCCGLKNYDFDMPSIPRPCVHRACKENPNAAVTTAPAAAASPPTDSDQCSIL